MSKDAEDCILISALQRNGVDHVRCVVADGRGLGLEEGRRAQRREGPFFEGPFDDVDDVEHLHTRGRRHGKACCGVVRTHGTIAHPTH